MAHNTKTLAMVGRRFAGGPAEALAPSNRVSAEMVRRAEERDAQQASVEALVTLQRRRAEYDAAKERGEMTHLAHSECIAALTALLWVEVEVLAKGVR